METRRILNLISRSLLATVFIAAGIGKVFAFRATAAMMAAAGFPFPEFFLVCAILIEIGGGLGLMLGLATRNAVASLLLLIIPATLIFHAAHITDPVAGQEQMIHTLKNIAIIGGLLKYLADGGGPLSIDERTSRKEIFLFR